MKEPVKTEPERLNFMIKPKQAERFNTYIIRVSQKQGRVPTDIKTKLLRRALSEWLDKHENDLDINWKEVE